MNDEYHQKKMDALAKSKAMEVDGVRDAMAITFVTMAERGDIDEVTAAEHLELFSYWQSKIDYKLGNIVRYGEDKLYKCESAHRSQDGWEPDKPTALWKQIGDPTVEYPEWSQPIGAGDGYQFGAKVSHRGKHWHSAFSGENIWEPGDPGTEALWVEDH